MNYRGFFSKVILGVFAVSILLGLIESKSQASFVIGAISVSNITPNSASVSFSTGASDSAYIQYWIGSQTKSSTTPTKASTGHTIVLNSLLPGQTYSFQAVVTTASGVVDSPIGTFQTPMPTISGLKSTVTTNSATISFNTDVPTLGSVAYGTTTAYNAANAATPSETAHTLSFTGLSPSVTYYYQASATQNINGQTFTVNETGTFQTQAIPPVLSDISPSQLTPGSAVVSFSADRAGGAYVKYGASSTLSLSTSQSAIAAGANTVSLTGLQAGQTYSYQVVSVAPSGNPPKTAAYSVATFTCPPTPVITSLSISNVTTTAATFSFTTNVATHGQVNYGTSPLLGSSVGPTGASVTHTLNLTGLSPAQTYYYQVVATEYTYGVASSAPPQGGSFQTAPLAPTISSLSTTQITPDSAAISFTASGPGNASISYGPTGGSMTATSPVAIVAGANTIQLASLTASQQYTYQVISTASSGTPPLSATSSSATFTTGALPVISGLSVGSITHSSATISFTTNVPVTAQINYGTTSSPLPSKQTASGSSTAFSITLTGLSASQKYYFQAYVSETVGSQTFPTTQRGTFQTVGSTASPSPSPSSSSLPTSNGPFMGLLINHWIPFGPASNLYSPTPWPSNVPVSHLRMWDVGTTWNDIEPSPAPSASPSWGTFDLIVDAAASHNVDLLYTFGYTPAWALPSNIAITAMSRSNGIVTVTTSAPNGLYYHSDFAATAQTSVNLMGITSKTTNDPNMDPDLDGTFLLGGTPWVIPSSVPSPSASTPPTMPDPTATTFSFYLAGDDFSYTEQNGVPLGYYSEVCSGTSGCQEAPYNIQNPANPLIDWDNFVTAVATRAAGRIKYWEMWNEANTPSYWKGSQQTLVTMTEHARAIIKGIDPDAVIVSPSVSYVYDAIVYCNSAQTKHGNCGQAWAQNWLETQALPSPGSTAAPPYGKDLIDIVNFHNYPRPSNSISGPEQVAGEITVEKNVLSSVGLTLPIWDTESSWGTDNWAYVSDFEDDFVAFLARHFLIQASMGIQRSYWYAYDGYGPSNTGWGTLWYAADLPGPDGLVGIAPAGTAYTNLYGWMQGASFAANPPQCVPTSTTPCPTQCAPVASGSSIWSCYLTMSNGTSAEAVWTTSPSSTLYSPTPPPGVTYKHYQTLLQTQTTPTPIPSGGEVTLSEEPILLVP